MPRLNKYIASTGFCSRRKADELILEGRVRVNDRPIEELGFYVREKDRVYIDNKLVKPQKLEYYKFYKPAGYITTSEDEKGRKTIYDVIPPELKHLKPVGRLDKESTGLIILTNDGEFINEMTHPSIKVPKVYIVSINGKFTTEDAEKMYRSPGGDVCSLYISGHLTGRDRQALCGRYSNLYSRRSHYSRLHGSSCSV